MRRTGPVSHVARPSSFAVVKRLIDEATGRTVALRSCPPRVENEIRYKHCVNNAAAVYIT